MLKELRMNISSGFFNREQILTNTISISLFIILCLALIFVSKLILKDVTDWIERPKTKSMITLNNFLKEKDLLDTQRDRARKSLKVSDRYYKSEAESYENWIKARTALGRTKEDRKILTKLRNLELYRAQFSQRQRNLDALTKKHTELKKKIYEVRQLLHTEADKDVKYRKSLQKYAVKIFILRLLFLIPIFAFGIILILDRRRNIYWPLSWGLIAFSVYMFFWDVMPYIPNFGFFRYVQYTGGLLVAGLVIYLMLLKLQQKLAAKSQNLQLPAEERLKRIDRRQGFRSYAQHICPSCEKNFLYRKWNTHSRSNRKTITESLAPNYCVYCGLRLFEQCEACKLRRYVYLPACPACGAINQNETK